ncbi:MAG TPA: hypothetical protein PKG51_07420, partial [Arachnia sp.]|nr:hypothetical protein [Arachnia sp.]
GKTASLARTATESSGRIAVTAVRDVTTTVAAGIRAANASSGKTASLARTATESSGRIAATAAPGVTTTAAADTRAANAGSGRTAEIEVLAGMTTVVRGGTRIVRRRGRGPHAGPTNPTRHATSSRRSCPRACAPS